MEKQDVSESTTYDLSVLTRDHILSAIKEIDENGVFPGRESITWDLHYKGKLYPPKYVIDLAYKVATGEVIDSLQGRGNDCYERLKELGFIMLHEGDEITGFYPYIQQFISQIDNREKLNSHNYLTTYNGLRVEVSFGKGKHARVPFIALLDEDQKVDNGIFPAFFYFSKQKILILAYGISETRKPAVNWLLPEKVQTIESYFLTNELGIPQKYGNSYVFEAYSPTSEIERASLEEDLSGIISIYNQTLYQADEDGETVSSADEPFDIHKVANIRKTGLLFSRDLLFRYVTSLLTKPFVILSGLSGSGKTRLALTFAKWMSHDLNQIKIVPVGSDWNNRECLLGCPNVLEPGKYIHPENGVLNFICQAIKNTDRPYFLILDEMNLSYVERYFSDFLSAMESGEPITLHPDTPEWNDGALPAEIVLPSNLYITGTINVDKTTYMFSPKVLDRANVIEFRIDEEEMKEYLKHCKALAPDAVTHEGAYMAASFTRISRDDDFTNDDQFADMLLSFFTQLKHAGAEFGYRTASEIYRFIGLSRKLNIAWNRNMLIDIVVIQKMLPKLHGSRKKMQPILSSLWGLCLQPGEEPILMDSDNIEIDRRFRYPLSAAKILQMYRNAKDNGFTSYAEA